MAPKPLVIVQLASPQKLIICFDNKLNQGVLILWGCYANFCR